ncbi:MAG: hypothetical protein HC893_02680 [Chloroflexaceae bacterium]|nr:hypothetical protein [Chloroflexaceae bacterium]
MSGTGVTGKRFIRTNSSYSETMGGAMDDLPERSSQRTTADLFDHALAGRRVTRNHYLTRGGDNRQIHVWLVFQVGPHLVGGGHQNVVRP